MSLPVGVKIDVRKVRYPVVRDALGRLRVTQVENDPTALLVWWDGYMPSEELMTICPHQRLNRIPGMDVLCFKNTFFQALTRMRVFYPSLYTFFPTTFQLPFQFSEFQKEHLRVYTENGKRGSSLGHGDLQTATWIIKPRNGCCGNGIRLIQNSFDAVSQTQPAIVQRYIAPFLIDGYKFDFRFYVLIAALQPFTLYVYREGLARFCTHLYAPPTRETLDDRFCHLTNTAVNVNNPNNTRPILELASNVLRRITGIDQRGQNLWERIRQAVTLSIVAEYPGMLQNVGMASVSTRRDGFQAPQKSLDEMHRYFHLLGIDIMINDRCEPVVLELNDRPSMCVTYELEHALKSGVIFDTLNIVSVDGEDVGARALPGGWERLLPADGDSGFSPVVHRIVEKLCHNAMTSAQKLVRKRFGYLPSASPSKSLKQIPASLPPLHQ
jgi:hypothetical protein